MKQKTFQWNRLDLLVIALGAILMLGVFWISREPVQPSAPVTGTYTIRFEALSSAQEGDAVTAARGGYDMGTVTAAETAPNGALNVTVAVQIHETDLGVTTASGCSIRVGTSVNCTIGGASAEGVIVGLSYTGGQS